MHQNVTIAEAVVLSCVRPTEPRRNRVVYEVENFPSVRYLYQAQPDLEVVVCENAEAIVAAIDERTLLVPISHVLFRSAEIQDVEAITQRAHEAGARVVLDCYQSAGTVPFDVEALGVDFAVGGSVKWLCGGPGNGWLYVRPDLIGELSPSFVGWQAHAAPFAFEPELRYAEGAERFLTGTPNVPGLYAATAGYDLIEEIGVERIRARSLEQTALLISLAEEAGFGIRSPRDPARRGGTVTVHVPEFEAVHRELGEREIICDFRPGAGIRLGPHFYNTDAELEHVIAEIRAVLETGAHRRWLDAAARLTRGGRSAARLGTARAARSCRGGRRPSRTSSLRAPQRAGGFAPGRSAGTFRTEPAPPRRRPARHRGPQRRRSPLPAPSRSRRARLPQRSAEARTS